MPSIIPFVPSDPVQVVTITLDGTLYVLRARWNSYDTAWYLDAWEGDGTTPIAYGVKLVQGARLGQQYQHPLFQAGLFMYDATDSGPDAGLDDFGTRVVLVHMTADDAVLMGALPIAATDSTLGPPT